MKPKNLFFVGGTLALVSAGQIAFSCNASTSESTQNGSMATSPLTRSDAVSASGEQAALRERKTAVLRQHNLNPDSTNDLFTALASEQVSLQLVAVGLLAERNEKGAIPKLRELLKSRNPTLLVSICEALHQLSEDSRIWQPTAVMLLESNYIDVRLRAAKLLADIKDPRGWDVVKQQLASKDVTAVVQATLAAPAFEGLSSSETKPSPISVLAFITTLYPEAEEQIQLHLSGLAEKVARPKDIPLLRKMLQQTKTQNSSYTKANLSRSIERLQIKG